MEQKETYFKIKGTAIPNMEEPKGLEYHRAIVKVRTLTEKKRKERSEALEKQRAIDEFLKITNENIAYSDDEEERKKLMQQAKEHEIELKMLESISTLDMERYVNKLFKDHNIKQLQKEAQEEYFPKKLEAEMYLNELRRKVKLIESEINNFVADTGSDSYTRTANRLKITVEGTN